MIDESWAEISALRLAMSFAMGFSIYMSGNQEVSCRVWALH